MVGGDTHFERVISLCPLNPSKQPLLTMKARRWTWTLNNPTRLEMIQVSKLSSEDGVNYLVCGAEMGSQKTFHLQGFLTLSSQQRLSWVKKLPGMARAHLETTKGSNQANLEYCRKDGQIFSIMGSLPREGTSSKGESHARPQKGSRLREDFDLIKKKIDRGAQVKDIYDCEDLFYTYAKNRKVFDEYHLSQVPIRTTPRVEVLVGKKGAGKTRYCWGYGTLFYDRDIWTYSGGLGGWFDGYTGQRVAIFDDFRGEIEFSRFLRVLDRYPERVPVKGSFAWFNPSVIFVTSNRQVDEWYQDLSPEDLAALRRRIHRHYWLKGPIPMEPMSFE